ncbi:MAG: hypothetical protein ACR2JW_14100 [Thermomicrobiales bacterium]
MQQYIDRMLSLLEWQWGRLPEVEAEIDNWDLLEQLDFIEEWPLEEERLKKVEHYRSEGVLTLEQTARYEEVKRLIARNRPIIRRLQNS